MSMERTVDSRCPKCRRAVKLHYALEQVAEYLISGNGVHITDTTRNLAEGEANDWRRRGYTMTATDAEPWFRWKLTHPFPVCEPCRELIDGRNAGKA
jgi:hypothetical protein